MSIKLPLVMLGALQLPKGGSGVDPRFRTERAVDDIMDALTVLETSPRTLGRRELADLDIAAARLRRYLATETAS